MCAQEKGIQIDRGTSQVFSCGETKQNTPLFNTGSEGQLPGNLPSSYFWSWTQPELPRLEGSVLLFFFCLSREGEGDRLEDYANDVWESHILSK